MFNPVKFSIIALLISYIFIYSASGNAESIAIQKVTSKFDLAASADEWLKVSGGVPALNTRLQLDSGLEVSLQVFMLYNEQYLFWGFIIQGIDLEFPDDFTPQFSGSDHLKLRYRLLLKQIEHADSILILPGNLFQEPLLVADYDYYQEQSNFFRNDIKIKTIMNPQSCFITLAIPFAAIKVASPLPGDMLNFDLAFYKATPSHEGRGSELWISSQETNPTIPFSAFFKKVSLQNKISP